MDDAESATARAAMVERQIARRGIADPALLAAMRAVPRHAFVPDDLAWRAYDDTPLPIGGGQTISQPYIVALMLEAAALRPGDRVLEVGAGSGYACAVAGRLAAHVTGIERRADLADAARDRLARLGFTNIALHCADGSGGWPAGAPYDAILVAAGGPRVPDALRAQLAPGGRLVMPVGASSLDQRLLLVTRSDDGFAERDLGGVMFVPLVGTHAWAPGAGD